MSDLIFPLFSKWACIFSTKERARYLDMVKLYADGTLDTYPTGSICLDAPLVLLNPEHPKFNPTRPSNIAQACDLFTDPICYAILRLVETDIMERKLYKAVDPLFYSVSAMDDRYSPTAVHAVHYGEALAFLRDLSAPTPVPPKPTP